MEKVNFTEKQKELIRKLYGEINCKGSSYKVPEATFHQFLYVAEKYDLDPISRQIFLTGYLDRNNTLVCSVIVAKDGMLEIAHRSGKLNGIEVGIGLSETSELIAWAKVYRKDMEHPFFIQVEESEYNTRQSTWATKPKTMLRKVALSQALKMAFSLSGLHSEEEIGSLEEQISQKEAQKETPVVKSTDELIEIKAIRKMEKSGVPYLQGITVDKTKFTVIDQQDVNLLMDAFASIKEEEIVKIKGVFSERNGRNFLQKIQIT